MGGLWFLSFRVNNRLGVVAVRFGCGLLSLFVNVSAFVLAVVRGSRPLSFGVNLPATRAAVVYCRFSSTVLRFGRPALVRRLFSSTSLDCQASGYP